mmetsp:Transcript_6275/g.9120  ORF Transcript_6275/g.9120 Transcript_6275/m.9120 type:complete len:846 (-) Transcript_6275:27-2564(-)
MTLQLDVKQQLVSRTKRVKCVDIHPKEPWVLCSLYSGKVTITNYKTNQVVRTFDIGKDVIRSAKFIPRMKWIVCGGDDMKIRVFNYNTGESVTTFEGHEDFIRCIAVHPTKPYILTSSDDVKIKLWDWEAGWKMVRVFDGHSHYIMQVVFSPKDPNIFASASLDKSIKVWNINKPLPNYSLEQHEECVNCLDFYHGADKPFLISGADDKTVKVWDYQTKTCVQTLEGHSHNVTAVAFHPKYPYIISCSEDYSFCIWNAQTYELEHTIDADLKRAWSIGCTPDTKFAIGYDMGWTVYNLGKEVPVLAMNKKGKFTYVKSETIYQGSIKQNSKDKVVDGENVSTRVVDKGVIDVPASNISYGPKGNYLSAFGERDYTILNSNSLKKKKVGTGLGFVWGESAGSYAVLQRHGLIEVYKNFKLSLEIKAYSTPVQLFGGHALGVKTAKDFILYDWESGNLVRSFEVTPNVVEWSEDGSQVVLADEDTFFLLNYDEDLVRQTFKNESAESYEDGIEDAVTLENQFTEKIKSGEWVGSCFIYLNNDSLNYYIGGHTETIASLDQPYYLLGFLTKYNRVYLMDKSFKIISYQLHISVMQYETAIANDDLESAAEYLKDVPEEFHTKLAQFLDRQNRKELKEIALTLTKDVEHQFQLALELNNLPLALQIAEKEDSKQKWKLVGSVALTECNFDIAKRCLTAGEDLASLLMMYTTIGDRESLTSLAEQARVARRFNIAFMSFWLLGDVSSCLDLLVESERYAEACAMARAYLPSSISTYLKKWQESTGFDALSDPQEYPSHFEGYMESVALEPKVYSNEKGDRFVTKLQAAASSYPEHAQDLFKSIDELLTEE